MPSADGPLGEKSADPFALPKPADPAHAALAVLHSVRPEFLTAAFAAIEEHSGSFEAYLAGPLDMDGVRLEALRAKLLEPA